MSYFQQVVNKLLQHSRCDEQKEHCHINKQAYSQIHPCFCLARRGSGPTVGIQITCTEHGERKRHRKPTAPDTFSAAQRQKLLSYGEHKYTQMHSNMSDL